MHHLARLLGYRGSYPSQWLNKIESGHRDLDYAKANLLLAIAEGYTPVGYTEAGADEAPASAGAPGRVNY